MRSALMFKKSGHTFIELLVVLVIISTLAFVSIPLFQGYTRDSKIDELKATLLKAAAAQEKYFASKGQYSALDSSLQVYGYPELPNDKMKLFTGVYFTARTGMTFWVAGNYDIDSNISNTYNECWIYAGTVLGTNESSNFIRLHDEVENNSRNIADLPFSPSLDDVCK